MHPILIYLHDLDTAKKIFEDFMLWSNIKVYSVLSSYCIQNTLKPKIVNPGKVNVATITQIIKD